MLKVGICSILFISDHYQGDRSILEKLAFGA